jgi:hypothetical protein
LLPVGGYAYRMLLLPTVPPKRPTATKCMEVGLWCRDPGCIESRAAQDGSLAKMHSGGIGVHGEWLAQQGLVPPEGYAVDLGNAECSRR